MKFVPEICSLIMRRKLFPSRNSHPFSPPMSPMYTYVIGALTGPIKVPQLRGAPFMEGGLIFEFFSIIPRNILYGKCPNYQVLPPIFGTSKRMLNAPISRYPIGRCPIRQVRQVFVYIKVQVPNE